MRTAACALCVWCCAACGDSRALSPTSPTQPAVTVIDTVTRSPVAQVGMSPSGQRTLFTAPGYVSRETVPAGTVDLFPEAGFDLTFYRQLARNEYEGTRGSLRVLSAPPAFYLQTLHLTDAQAAALEATARAVVPMWTGGRFTVTTWETGREPRQPSTGWIVIDIAQSDPTGWCGQSTLGNPRGHIVLTLDTPACRSSSPTVTLAHELGHALGFSHVSDPSALMYGHGTNARPALPTEKERHHARLAYARPPGNLDVDVDPLTPGRETAYVVVD